MHPGRLTAPEVVERDHGTGQLRRVAQHRVRNGRRQAHLQALDVSADSPDAAGEQPGDDVASRPPPVGVVDDRQVIALADVDEERDCRVRDDGEIDGAGVALAEPCHGNTRHPTRPLRRGDVPQRGCVPNRLVGSHADHATGSTWSAVATFLQDPGADIGRR